MLLLFLAPPVNAYAGENHGAHGENRTRDLALTKGVLYH